jgi:hypothetical protein
MMTDDPRDALMSGRTIKTTGITALRADPSTVIRFVSGSSNLRLTGGN